MKKNRRNIVLIITVVIICLYCDSLLLINYNYKNQKLHSIEEPMDIANEFMQSKYNAHWKRVERVFSAGKNREGRYIIGRGMENIGSSYFSGPISKKGLYISCKTRIEGFQIITISSSYNSLSWKQSVGVLVKIYNGDKRYWEDRVFLLEYDDEEYTPLEFINDEYTPNKAGLEEATGMTIEEIVEIAEKQQEDCENMLYEMKEAEMKGNKRWLFKGLLRVNGIGIIVGIWLIIRKGLKKKSCLFCQK